MYPTVHFDGAINPLLAPYPSVEPAPVSSSRSRNPPPPPVVHPTNGPVTPAAATAFPTLQVTIDPRLQVAPPVLAPARPPGEGGPAPGSRVPPPPPGQPAPGGGREPVDLELERRLLRDLAPGGSGGDSNGPLGSGSLQVRDDPYEVLLSRYTAMGYSRDEVAMALTVVGPNHSNDADSIVDACRKYQKLVGMGFLASHAVGALIMHGGDLEQATNACLDAAS